MAKDVPQPKLDQLADLAARPDASEADQVKGGAGGAGTPTPPIAPVLKPISTPKYIVPCV